MFAGATKYLEAAVKCHVVLRRGDRFRPSRALKRSRSAAAPAGWGSRAEPARRDGRGGHGASGSPVLSGEQRWQEAACAPADWSSWQCGSRWAGITLGPFRGRNEGRCLWWTWDLIHFQNSPLLTLKENRHLPLSVCFKSNRCSCSIWHFYCIRPSFITLSCLSKHPIHFSMLRTDRLKLRKMTPAGLCGWSSSSCDAEVIKFGSAKAKQNVWDVDSKLFCIFLWYFSCDDTKLHSEIRHIATSGQRVTLIIFTEWIHTDWCGSKEREKSFGFYRSSSYSSWTTVKHCDRMW